MKRVIISFILSIFLFTIVLAIEPLDKSSKTIYDFDNIKSIKNIEGKQYPDITIKNTFGIGKDVWKGKLDKNTKVCTNDCSAEQTIEITEPTELISDIRFLTLKEDGSWQEQPIRSYQLYINSSVNEIEVEDYENQCSVTGTLPNGTQNIECSKVLVGTHTEYTPEWIPYNIGEVLPAGLYKIKLEGQKKPSRTVDWQIKTNGKWLDEWAVWGSISLPQENLRAYYDLEETSGVVIDRNGNYNLTNNGADTQINGKIGNAYQFERSDGDYLNYSGNLGITNYPFSYNFWINSTDNTHPEQDFVCLGSTSNDNIDYCLNGGAGTGLHILARDGTSIDSTKSNVVLNVSEWVMLTAVFENSTSRKLYLNGENILNQTDNIAYQNTNIAFRIGNAENTGANDADAVMDEISIYNTTLTQEQIYILYNGGTGITYPEATVTLNSPADASTSSTNNVQFNATASITSGAYLTNMSLWTNESGSWTINTTEYDLGYISNVTNTNLNNNLLLYVKNNFNGSVDNVSTYCQNSAQAHTCTFKIEFNLSNGTSINVYNTSTGGISAITEQVTSNPLPNSQLNSIAIYANATTYNPSYLPNFKNSSFYVKLGTNYNAIFNKTITTTTLWNVQACDSDGDCGFATSNYSLGVDATPPQLTINSPNTLLDYGGVGVSETLNWTVTDSNLDSVWFDYNGTNITLVGASNTTTFALESGNYNLTLWANDSVGNINSTYTNWSYKIFEESKNYNTTTAETASETFTINATANSSLTAVALDYNGTEYSLSSSSGNYTTTFDIPLNKLQNNSIRWKFTYGAETIYSDYFYQNVSETVFTLCNASYTNDFLNITFKDEASLSYINASIPSSNFVYYLGSGVVNKTYTYTESSNNFNYTFCATPTDRTLNVDPYVQYKQGTDYPQRIWDASVQTYNSTMVEKILYLLGSADGIYVTFQVINPAEQAISGVTVNATRTISGEEVVVGDGETDAAGAVTFWLNPDFSHTLFFQKTGYESLLTSLTPTQTTYTITLGGSTSVGVTDYSQGISISTKPSGNSILSNTSYLFNYSISSSYWSLTEYGFTLSYSNGTTITTQTGSTDVGSTLSYNLTTPNSSRIIMDYYYLVNSTYTNGSRSWVIYSTNDFSIQHFIERASTYIGQDLYGIQSDDGGFFSKAVLSIFIIIILSGTISYRYGISSEAGVTAIIFAIVFFLNSFDFIPTPSGITFVDLGDFIVTLVAIWIIASIFKEESR